MKTYMLALVATTTLAAVPAVAQNTTVTTLNGSQGGFANYAPNTTSSATITSNTALEADGSLQISGTLNRVQNANQFGATTAQSLGLANDLVSLTGDFLVTNSSVDGFQSPAFRVFIQDGTQRSELIYEAVYNGGYTVGTESNVTANSLFYQNIAGGVTNLNGGILLLTLEAFGNNYNGNAFISAFGVGNGNCPNGAVNCANFSALADNLALTTTAGTRSVNFAASPVAGAVPEPGTWAMMLVGFGGIGGAMRRRRKLTNIAQLA